jgi:hypothetical protein
VLVLDMIEILPSLGKYKYDTWRILPVKCYIDNSMCFQSCIRNINKHFCIQNHSFPRFTSRFIVTGLLGFLIRHVSKKNSRGGLRMSFMQLADENYAEAWECYHGFMIDLPTTDMKDWEFTKGFYCGLSQEAKEHIDSLIEEPSSCSTPKKREFSLRSFPLAKGRVRSMV